MVRTAPCGAARKFERLGLSPGEQIGENLHVAGAVQFRKAPLYQFHIPAGRVHVDVVEGEGQQLAVPETVPQCPSAEEFGSQTLGVQDLALRCESVEVAA